MHKFILEIQIEESKLKYILFLILYYFRYRTEIWGQRKIIGVDGDHRYFDLKVIENYLTQLKNLNNQNFVCFFYNIR